MALNQIYFIYYICLNLYGIKRVIVSCRVMLVDQPLVNSVH